MHFCVFKFLEVMFTVAARSTIPTGTTSFSRRLLQVNALVIYKRLRHDTNKHTITRTIYEISVYLYLSYICVSVIYYGLYSSTSISNPEDLMLRCARITVFCFFVV